MEEFSSQFSLMDAMERRNMVEFFILPFLRTNTTGEMEVSLFCTYFGQNLGNVWEIFKVIVLCLFGQIQAVCSVLTPTLSGC